MQPSGILLLEGADSAGKTSLARYFRTHYGARYIHGGLYKDAWPWHVAAIRRAVRLSEQGDLVVIDRNWISHLIYGAIYNNKVYDVGARCIDRVLRRYGALIVACIPQDPRRQAARWEADKAAGKREHYASVQEAINLYLDLYHGNLACSVPGYLGQFVRFSDFADRDDVIRYDIDANGRNMAQFAAIALNRLKGLRRNIFRSELTNIAGRAENPARATLITGLPNNCTFNKAPWKTCSWFDRDTNNTDITWLNRALQHLLIREDRLEFADVVNSPDIYVIRDRGYGKIISLGSQTHAVLKSLGLSSYLIPEPKWHMENKYDDGPEGYADEYLREPLSR